MQSSNIFWFYVLQVRLFQIYCTLANDPIRPCRLFFMFVFQIELKAECAPLIFAQNWTGLKVERIILLHRRLNLRCILDGLQNRVDNIDTIEVILWIFRRFLTIGISGDNKESFTST